MGTGASIPVNSTTSLLTDDPTQTTSLIATLLDGFINLPSSLNKELAAAIGANPAAMKRLKELGYEFKEVEEHVEAQLPSILANFSILKESDGIAKILNDPSFQAAQDAVAKTPNGVGFFSFFFFSICSLNPNTAAQLLLNTTY